MTIWLPRSAWDSRPAPRTDLLVRSRVQGVAVHWPGLDGVAPVGQSSVASLIRGWRDHHVTGRGWSDIAYQVAVDKAGRVWTLRGHTHQSAANGDADTNRAYGALLLVLGTRDESVPPEMIEAVQDWRAQVWLDTFPGATSVVGHGQIRPHGTECPGPAVRAVIKAGLLSRRPAPQPPPQEDDMPTAGEVASAVLGAKFREYVDQDGDGTREHRTVSDIMWSTHASAVGAERATAQLTAQITELTAAVTRLADRLDQTTPPTG